MLFGLGARLQVPAAINFVSFFCIGIPVGAALAYQAGLGVQVGWPAPAHPSSQDVIVR